MPACRPAGLRKPIWAMGTHLRWQDERNLTRCLLAQTQLPAWHQVWVHIITSETIFATVGPSTWARGPHQAIAPPTQDHSHLVGNPILEDPRLPSLVDALASSTAGRHLARRDPRPIQPNAFLLMGPGPQGCRGIWGQLLAARLRTARCSGLWTAVVSQRGLNRCAPN